MIGCNQLGIQRPRFAFAQKRLTFAQSDCRHRLRIGGAHAGIRIPHAFHGVDDAVLRHTDAAADAAALTKLIAEQMLGSVHDELAGTPGHFCHQDGLQDHVRNQLFRAIRAARMTRNYADSHAGNRRLRVKFLQVRCATVIPNRNRRRACPLCNAARTFRRQRMRHVFVFHVRIGNIL